MKSNACMAEIAPAVLAESPQQYRHDLEIATSVSDRVQIDLVDGSFASNTTINLVQAYWPDAVRADLHLMYNDPYEHVSTIIAQNPHLAIIHIEAKNMDEESIAGMRTDIQSMGVGFGIAVLPDTPVEAIAPHISDIDHVLVFTGELGHYGGQLRFDCLEKISQIKHLNGRIEVGVDGGITDETAETVVKAGADVLNVGGFIQNATHPKDAYATLEKIINRQT